MAGAVVGEARYPSPDELRTTLLQALQFSYAARGLVANILPGGDHYIRCDAFSKVLAIAIANNQIAAQDANPLTATGDALVELASIFGVQPRDAAPSAGGVLIVSSGAVTIPDAFSGTMPDGQRYQTVGANTYANGASVQVVAQVGGAATNQLAGGTFTWDSAAIAALSPTATVDAGGFTGGVDADNDDRLRDRLLRKLSAAPVGGNWSSVTQWAEDASASVSAAYCYPAEDGAASYGVAVVKAGGDRTIPAATLGVVRSYILARMPGQNALNLTTITPQGVDVVLLAQLPLPSTAGGAGGGWRDAAPWPAETTKVTAYNSGTGAATVNSVAAPTVGASIGVWDSTFVDPLTGAVGRMNEYNVATVGGVSGAWIITIQQAWSVSPLLGYVSAGAVGLVEYARSFADQAAKLGPGEKTLLPELLPRASRQPAPDARDPANLTNRLVDVPLDAFREILDLTYALRVATHTASALTSPSVPTNTSDPPNLLVLKEFAIRA